MRGGSSSSIQDCNVEIFKTLVELLKTEFGWKNDRLDVRKAVNETGCTLAALKEEFIPSKLYQFGFSIRELIDTGYSIDELVQAGLDDKIFTGLNGKFKSTEYNTLTVNEKEYADMLQEKLKQKEDERAAEPKRKKLEEERAAEPKRKKLEEERAAEAKRKKLEEEEKKRERESDRWWRRQNRAMLRPWA